MFRRLPVLLIVGVGVAGCERESQSPPVVSATQSSTEIPTTQPATLPTRPPSFIAIDQQPYEFPPARLSLQVRDGRVAALLFSDDPRDAINRDYLGHSYYLPMMLDIGSVDELPDAVWSCRVSAADQSDTNAGIFLEGDRVQLVPVDVQVRFEVLDERETVVILAGGFRWKDEDRTAPLRMVSVSARLAAEVKLR